KHFPECKVTFLVRNYTKDLAENHPYIDNIIILKEENGNVVLGDNIKALRKYNFDSSIIVYPTFVTALIIFLSGIKKRIVTGYRLYSLLCEEKVFEHRKYDEQHEHEVNVNLRKKFGSNAETTPSNQDLDLYLNPESDKEVKKLFRDIGVNPHKPK